MDPEICAEIRLLHFRVNAANAQWNQQCTCDMRCTRDDSSAVGDVPLSGRPRQPPAGVAAVDGMGGV